VRDKTVLPKGPQQIIEGARLRLGCYENVDLVTERVRLVG